MSRGINKVILIGNLGRDPELSYTPGGLAIARLNLATTESRKKDDGTWEDLTEWHRVKVFGKTGENLPNYASKGSQIFVEGRIHYDSWERDGVKHYTTEIIATTVRVLGRREDSGGGGGGGGGRPQQDSSYPSEPASSQQAGGMGGDIEDDLPF